MNINSDNCFKGVIGRIFFHAACTLVNIENMCKKMFQNIIKMLCHKTIFIICFCAAAAFHFFLTPVKSLCYALLRVCHLSWCQKSQLGSEN